MRPRWVSARLLEREDLGAGYHRLCLEAPPLAAGAAGTFTLLSVRPRGAGALDPLLPRPFSFLSRDPERGRVEVLVKVVGRGTAALAGLVPGVCLQALGPLGQGFPEARAETLLLLAGGVGMPPILDLASEEARRRRVVVFYGGRGRRDLLLLERFEALGVTLVASTDNGSFGVPGTNVGALRAWLAKTPEEKVEVFACGPRPMLRAAQALAAQAGLRLWLSLEAHMACGIGVCRGCAVRRADGPGYHMVCADGPVLPAEAVVL